MKLLLFALLVYSSSFSQGFAEYIAENAIEINGQSTENQKLYAKLKDYQLIMVGEMHGTQEPAQLVKTLSEVILNNETAVSIGLEIPREKMKAFLNAPNEKTVRASTFFAGKNHDGRSGQAWFDLISYCVSEPKINLFFFDNYEALKIENRDSAMFLGIRNHKINSPDTKIITLSGNLHNRLIPRGNHHTMGSYCKNDSLTFPTGTLCAINHAFSEGTMMNSSGNGLELKTIEFEESVFSQATDLENYLIFYETVEPSANNGIFYTRKVHHSSLLEP